MVLARLTQDFRSLNETSFVRFAEAAKLDRAVLRVNAELYAIGSLAANANDAKLLAARIAAVQQRMDDLTRDAAAVTGLAGRPVTARRSSRRWPPIGRAPAKCST